MALLNGRLVQAVLLVCTCCFWACAAAGTQHAAAGTQHADCKLELVGGDTSGSFSKVVLECSSETGALVDIAIDSQLKEFVKGFKGVRFPEVMHCQGSREAKEFRAFSLKNRPVLLSFCGDYSVNLEQPILRDIKAGFENNKGAYSSLLLFGGKVHGTISAGVFEGNSEFTNVLYLLGTAQVVVQAGTVCRRNSGGRGTCAATTDRSGLHITSSSLKNNSAAELAGAVVSTGKSSIVIRDSQLTGNVVKSTDNGADGGACLAADNSTMQLINTLLASNSAGFRGGGAAAWGNASLRITNCNVTGNRAPTGGGGVASWVGSSVVIRGSQLTGNNVTGADAAGGGCVAGGNSTMLLVNTSLASNSAGGSGGGAAARDQAELNITNCSVIDNTAPNLAGGVGSLHESSVIIRDSQLTGNSVTGADAAGGGCVAVMKSRMQLVNTSLASNSAGGSGGGAAALDQAELNITNCNVTGNMAGGGAGGVGSWQKSSVIIKDSQLTGNNATGAGAVGGGCVAWMKSRMQLVDTSLASNSASGSGGGAAARDQAELNITNCNVNDNTAPDLAGGVASWQKSSVIIKDSQLTGNSVTGASATGGGCAALMKSRMQLVNTSLASNSAGWSGGGAAAWDQAELRITNCNVTGNTAGSYAGGVHVAKSTSLTVQETLKLLNNTAGNGAGGGLTVTDSGVVHIDTDPGSLCAQNSAPYGGCLFTEIGTVVNISGAINITDNTASASGGGIYATGRLLWTLGNRDKPNKFIYGNQAKVYGGGALLLLLEIPDMLAVAASTFNNTAQYDSNLSVQQTNLGFSRPNMTIANAASFGSGTKLASITQENAATTSSAVARNIAVATGVLSVQLYVWGPLGWPCEGIDVAAWHAERGFLANSTSGSGGLAKFSIYSLPIGNHTITFNLTKNSTVPSVTGNFVISGCAMGQVVDQGGACQYCAAGVYSQNPTDTQCSACPDNAECSGGAAVLPLTGFWHSSVGSPHIYKCPNPEACNGNRTALQACSNSTSGTACDAALASNNRNNYIDLQCSDRYAGNLCGVCAEGSGSIKPFTCRPCRPKSVILGLFICAAVLLLGFMHVLCHFTRKENNQMQQKLQQQRQHSLTMASFSQSVVSETGVAGALTTAQAVQIVAVSSSSSGSDGSSNNSSSSGSSSSSSSNSSGSAAASDRDTKMVPTDLLKPAVIYMQYLLIIASLSGVEWPTPLLLSFKALAWVWSSATPETVTIECILPSTGLPLAYVKTIFYLCMPIGMLLALLFVQWASMRLALWRKHSAMPLCWQCGVGGCGSSSSSASNYTSRLATACVVVVLFSLPLVVRTTLSLFACIPLDGVSVWSQDTNTVCYTGHHKKFALGLGLPLVLLVCIALPTWVIVLTLRARRKHNLTEPGFSSRFGSLVRPYRVKYCWWEGLVICQTIMLVTISVFAHTVGAFNQAIILNAGIAVVLLLLVVFHPLAHKEANHVMQQAMCCLLLTSYVALTFLPIGDAVPTNIVYGIVMGSVVLIVNLVFVGSVVWRFARLVEWTGVVNNVLSYITGMYASMQAAMPINKPLKNSAHAV